MSKKYLISGASGFVGGHIGHLLSDEDFDSIGRSDKCLIRHDFYDGTVTPEIVNNYDYLIIVSGRAHVENSAKDELLLQLQANFFGVQSILKGLNNRNLKGVVYLSSVAVYGSKVSGIVHENAPYVYDTPYAISKILAERFLLDWSDSTGIPVLILRAPLIAGKNPPGNLGKLMKGIRTGKYLSVGSGVSRRSMVLVADLAICILSNCGKHGVYNLSDGSHPTLKDLEMYLAKIYNVRVPKSIPLYLAKCFAILGDYFSFIPLNSRILQKISSDFIVDDSLARRDLGWNPKPIMGFLDDNT
jgi:nucleoside-diphosphate-sugar epimerase